MGVGVRWGWGNGDGDIPIMLTSLGILSFLPMADGLVIRQLVRLLVMIIIWLVVLTILKNNGVRQWEG